MAAPPSSRHPPSSVPPRAWPFVRDVGAGTVPGDEEPGKVGPVLQPWLQPERGVLGHPVERLPRVIVRRQQPVLRRQAVLHGHHHHARLRRHPFRYAWYSGVNADSITNAPSW